MGKKKKNPIVEDHGEWVVLDVSTKSYKNKSIKIDKADLQIFTGRICFSNSGYAVSNFKGKTKPVHHWLNPEWKMTDHINRDKRDNRRANLRESNKSQNALNIDPISTNTSGTTGVTYDKRF